MEAYKIDKNVEFDVLYSDGTKRHVEEGILFEGCKDNTTQFHIGTSKPNVLMAFFSAVVEMMDAIGCKGKVISKEPANVHADPSRSKVHICRRMPHDQKVVYLDNPSGWYFVDENPEVIKKMGNSAYGTAIRNCPFCGEKLY